MANPKEILLKSIQMVIKIDILRLFNKKERISGMRVFPQGFLVFPFRSVSLYLRYFDVA